MLPLTYITKIAIIDNDEFEYVPDFVKLAEAYGAQGIRVTKVEELEAAFTKADAFKKGPTLIECIVPTELNVLPWYQQVNR